MSDKRAIIDLSKEILEGSIFELKIDTYSVEENFKSGMLHIHCEAHHAQSGEKYVINGVGVGIVDAFFQGLIEMYAEDYPSLKRIRFADFTVTASIEQEQFKTGSDSAAEVSIRIANSENHEFTFSHLSRSLLRSCLLAVLDGVSFFINSERAFVAVTKALQFAKESQRHDSIQRYTQQLATLVEATSYDEVVNNLDKN
ncbi:MAG: hypothetical protein CMH60_06010 [Myxococcales bacterium]|nr:hypothetical protein [Myxococcales bacterium]